MWVDYIRLSRVFLRISAHVRFARYRSKWITSDCAVTRADGLPQDHARVVEDFLKFSRGELSPGGAAT